MNEGATILTRPDQTRPDQTTHVQNSGKKKALIVTLYTARGNYGNTLQHYALQETVRSFGFDINSLYCPRDIGKIHAVVESLIARAKNAAKFMLGLFGVKKYRAYIKLRSQKTPCPVPQEMASERLRLFREFYDQNITGTVNSTYRDTLTGDKSRWKQYDYIIAGSDQVWNLSIIKTFEALRYHYLRFAEQSQRVCYAPSFGVSRLKFYERHVHREGLSGFDRLSCREEDGCRLIRELTGRDAQLVLDPTLLLTAEQWRKAARKPDYPVPEHYALMYFLDQVDSESQYIRNFADGLEIVDIYSPSEKYYYLTGPHEFLWLIDHADKVLTSSFHGTAFAVNFRKTFVSFSTSISPYNWFSRIRTLLCSLGLEDRICNIYDSSCVIPDAPIDFKPAHEKLASMRKSSMQYLRDCLHIN